MTIDDLNPKTHPLSSEIEANLSKLILAITQLERAYGVPFTVDSGYRTKEEQLKINPAAPNSAHCLGMAVDVADVTGKIYHFCESHIALLQDLGIYVEQRGYTPSWIHLQIRPTRARFFIP